MKYLNYKAASHSKSKDLRKSDKRMEKYLDDQRFSSSDCQLLFQLRSRMLSVKTNFPSMWKNDVSCRLCNDSVMKQSQEHLMSCTAIKNVVDVPANMKYRDIFGHVDKQLEVVKTFRKIVRQMEIQLNCEQLNFSLLSILDGLDLALMAPPGSRKFYQY